MPKLKGYTSGSKKSTNTPKKTSVKPKKAKETKVKLRTL